MHEPGQAPREPSGEFARSGKPERVPVWDWPLRMWHWALVVFVLIAWFTPSKYDSLHRLAGYVVIGLLVFRLGWGFLGTRYSRFRAVRARLRVAPAYLWGLRYGRSGRYMGLNPAGAAMMVALLSLLAISTITGAMQVTVRFFGVWWVEDTHAYSSDAVMVLVGLHVIGTILMSIVQRENLIWAMFTGRKLRRPAE